MWEEGRARRAAVAGEVERGMWRLERQRGRAGSRAFVRLRVRGLTVETRYKPDRTAHIASLPDPTASRLTGDVALSGVRWSEETSQPAGPPHVTLFIHSAEQCFSTRFHTSEQGRDLNQPQASIGGNPTNSSSSVHASFIFLLCQSALVAPFSSLLVCPAAPPSSPEAASPSVTTFAMSVTGSCDCSSMTNTTFDRHSSSPASAPPSMTIPSWDKHALRRRLLPLRRA